MLDSQQYEHPLQGLQQIVSVQDLIAAQHAVREVYLNHDIKNYIVNLVTTTRQHLTYISAQVRAARWQTHLRRRAALAVATT